MTRPLGSSRLAAVVVPVGEGVPFVKGHGTENDFVLLPDREGALDVGPELVRRVCDRRAGVGGDGVLRIAPTASDPAVAAYADIAPWFMDYRNGDGSVAEMCGNGIRVFARFLVAAGWSRPGELAVATRDGVKRVRVGGVDDDVVVDMGRPQLLPLDGVHASIAGRRYLGTAVSMGNPHLVLPVADLGDCDTPLPEPVVEPATAFPYGVNVELVLGRGPGRLAMRVHERGVGETRSCGTGACAAAVAGRLWWGPQDRIDTVVDVPGGVLRVTEDAAGELWLAGNAVLVASGLLSSGWLTASGDFATAAAAEAANRV